MTQRHLHLDTFYRFALGAYIVALVLAIFAGTSDPTIDIKELLTSWAACVLAGSYVAACLVLRRPLRRPPIFLEVTLCLLGFLLIATFFSDFFRFSLLETGKFFSLFALYWLASQVFSTPAQIFRFFTVFCSAMFIAGLYAVLQKVGLDPFPWGDTTSDTYTNLPATFGNPNYAAHALILALIMIVCLVRSGARWTGWLFLPVLLFHFHATDQRAGWIALAGAGVLAALAYVFLRRTRHPVVGVAGTAIAFAGIGVMAVAGILAWTYTRTGVAFPLDLSLLLRYQSYVSATNMLFDSPVVGHGPAVYGLAYPPYWTPFEQEWFAQEGLMNEHVHNDLLELAIDGGVAAAGLYLIMLVLGLCHGLLLVARGATAEHRRLGYTFAALFCAFAIDGLFGFNLRVPVTAALFFLMMGLLDGLVGAGQPAAVATASRALPVGFACRAGFIALLALSAWQETRQFASEYYFYHGIRAQNRARLDEAAAAYTNAAHYADWNWHVPRRAGLLELQRERPEAALAAFEESLEKNPAHFLTHLPMARANLMLAQAAVAGTDNGAAAATTFLNTARAHAQDVLALCPTYPAANDLLARVESIAAIVNRDESATPDPAIQAAHWRNARQHLRDALDHGAENSGDLYRMLVQVELAAGDIDAAGQALEDALRVSEDDEKTWPTFVTFAREYKRYPQLRDALNRQIQRLQKATPRPDDRLASACRWLAVVQEEGFNDLKAAEDALNRAVAYGPDQPEIWSLFAAFARKHERMPALDAAIQSTCAAIDENATPPLPQVAAVNALLTDPTGPLEDASRTLLAAVRAHPQSGALSVHAAFGWAAERIEEAFARRGAADEASCKTALNLGIISASLDNLARANRHFEHALGCLTGDLRPFAAVHWADTLSRVGQNENALALLQEMEREFPGHFDTRWAIARTLARQNDREAARAAYQSLLNDTAVAPHGREQIERELAALSGAS